MDEECIALVNNLDIDAVVLDVPATGTAGVTGKNTGALSGRRPWAVLALRAVSDLAACSSRILRRLMTVCFAIRLSDDEDEPADSSVGGVMGRTRSGDLGVRPRNPSAVAPGKAGSNRR